MGRPFYLIIYYFPKRKHQNIVVLISKLNIYHLEGSLEKQNNNKITKKKTNSMLRIAFQKLE